MTKVLVSKPDQVSQSFSGKPSLLEIARIKDFTTWFQKSSGAHEIWTTCSVTINQQKQDLLSVDWLLIAAL